MDGCGRPAEFLANARAIWRAEPGANLPPAPGWPTSGLAILGDFSGIQKYVLRPVPGAAGAARRLRARSLRVVVLTQLIADWVARELGDTSATVFYCAGGRFLVHAPDAEGCQERIRDLQRRLDVWLAKQFHGEVAFHLAAAPFSGGRIPGKDLHDRLFELRERALEGALLDGGAWNEKVFFRPTAEGSIRCPACLRTVEKGVPREEQEICEDCNTDTDLGAKISRMDAMFLEPAANGEFGFLDGCFTVAGDQARGSTAVEVVHGSPRGADGQALDFEQLAERARGSRKWLAYVRMDADRIGIQFESLKGDPARTWALSRFLQVFFCDRLGELIRSEFPLIYPVYGGGDDLFVIGPWDTALDFALRLSKEFSQATGGMLTLSAGVSLAKPHQHILTKSDQAADALEREAKQKGRSRIAALGQTAAWDTFEKLLQRARRLARWREDKLLPSALLQDILGLHSQWKTLTESSGARRNSERWRPLLRYQIERNLKGERHTEVKKWASSLLGKDSEWPWADFLVRYAMLAAGEDSE